MKRNKTKELTWVLADDPAFVVLLDVLSDGDGQLVLQVGQLLDRCDLAAQVGTLGQGEVKISAAAAQGSVQNVGFATLALELESSIKS